ncbi:hypothetical protein H5410_013729 [Solanum commersonii]|uniref:Uncharacterized protein n=1 Tax=Solanum commersonii TaxID=4109 RepID=A0A9J5ZP13_SOLCO|nr:hypothetical protein H5410_013729 [Solanum commersonii]
MTRLQTPMVEEHGIENSWPVKELCERFRYHKLSHLMPLNQFGIWPRILLLEISKTQSVFTFLKKCGKSFSSQDDNNKSSRLGKVICIPASTVMLFDESTRVERATMKIAKGGQTPKMVWYHSVSCTTDPVGLAFEACSHY